MAADQIEDPVEVRFELDDRGRSSGVEEETTEPEGLGGHEPFDPRRIDVTTETRTLDSVIRRLKLGQIDLDPDFQRSRGIWSDEKKSLLIESLLLRIPLPTFYVAELDTAEELGADRWAVVDGIQRLSTIAEFISPFDGQEPLRLSKVEYLSNLSGLTYDELPPALQLRVDESQFTFQIIRRSTPEPVQLNIFARINTGGVPLSQQELRHALTPGPARLYLRELAHSNAFVVATMASVSVSRMADREMVLRYLAFRHVDFATYSAQDFNVFLRSAMKEINTFSTAEFEAARNEFDAVMWIARSIFGKDAFRKRYRATDPRRPVSKALFESIAVAIARVRSEKDGDVTELVGNATKVRRGFMNLMKKDPFERAISQGTGDPKKVRERFTRCTELMRRYA